MLYRSFLKRWLDMLVAFTALLLLSPVFIVVTVLLFIANSGKPFFLQPRPGLKGRVFRVIKYKTMNDKKAPDGNLLPDEARLTAVGKFVRKTSLDEIPQLINVLKGDMSLIGPRPLLVDYLELYSPQQARRHEVRPGITGWAQVNGRNAISWTQKFERDVWYVDHLSFQLDVKILFMTVIKVFKSEGISQAGHVSSERFTGKANA
ncbi:Sugar transferase involved in LPS biosynthesis (colanic, teichoic acid) [Chitinophaga eiseniae]|uniref:Sugar transferase involved in LPS biosynthesis (Colanic, teichoic acid) n=1 Tax=Chitinophaga eiseniae TaxID=634771 RepID=A0A1T4NPN2_9BACT|nr:sugar transferase [Chitinophaga eiseniae]SJZ81240.1 Sugar transferase involved in LPS biosynthesis (colanic, teichoic acid) [Chitinophaga eiseniae]